MELVERSLVRLFREDSQAVVGAGFLISNRHIITCAHVVVAALGNNGSQLELGSLAKINFPFLNKSRTLSAKVVLRKIVSDDFENDIAVLELLDELPNEALPARLIDTSYGIDQQFSSYGFPAGYSDGIWITGVLKRKVASGRIQVEDVKRTGYFIEQGFSGAPIWNNALGGVIGMVVSADSDPSARVAFAIPIERIRRFIGNDLLEFRSVYHIPAPKQETLPTNLLPVSYVPPRIFMADAIKQNLSDIWREFRRTNFYGNEWSLREGRILSFHNLEETHWDRICDQGTIEEFDTEDWANTSDEDRQREYVYLLNQCLRTKVRDELSFDKEKKYFYFPATDNLKPYLYRYQSNKQKTERQVFAPYFSKTVTEHDTPFYYRHSAFSGYFKRFDNAWFLEITPTYHFTSDGVRRHPMYETFIKKIKQIERNQAVMGQVRMWSYFLSRQPEMFMPAYDYLSFGPLLSLELAFGINDSEWLSHEEDDQITTAPIEDTPLL